MLIRKEKYGLYTFIPVKGHGVDERFYDLLLNICSSGSETKLHFAGCDTPNFQKLYFEIPGYASKYSLFKDTQNNDRREPRIEARSNNNVHIREMHRIFSKKRINPSLLSIQQKPVDREWALNELQFQIGFLETCYECKDCDILIQGEEVQTLCLACKEKLY